MLAKIETFWTHSKLFRPFKLGSFQHVLFTSLQDSATYEILRAHVNRRRACLQKLHPTINANNLPSVEEIVQCSLSSPADWDLTRSGFQYTQEQTAAIKDIVQMIECYINQASVFNKHRFYVGYPGSGKTTVALHATIYAASRGLNILTTALAGLRAEELGGNHIHDIFCLPLSSTLSVGVIVERSLQKLYNRPEKIAFLKKVDFINFEEVGLINSKYMAAIDGILQQLKKSSTPFGGTIIIATGDPNQCKPPSGEPIWASSSMFTDVRVIRFQQCVRYVNESDRQFLSKITKHTLTANELDEIKLHILTKCHFSTSEDNLDKNNILVFGKRSAERKAVQKKISHLQHQGTQVDVIPSTDEVRMGNTGQWLPASTKAFKDLDRLCSEPSKLYLYQGAVLLITMNSCIQNFKQGQLCVFWSQDTEQRINVLLAPPGVLETPTNAITPEMYLTSDWTWQKLSKTPGFNQWSQGKSCRRVQYPVKNFIAMTVHKSMGGTLPRLVTRVSLTESEFVLWERAQVYVIFSRVRRLSDITFIGDKQQTIDAILSLLQRASPWDEYVEQFLSTASNRDSVYFPAHQLSSFRPISAVIPTRSCGFVYALISTKLNHLVYINETLNIRQTLYDHNTGDGGEDTSSSSARPWGLVMFAAGFNDDPIISDIERRELADAIKDGISVIEIAGRLPAGLQAILNVFRTNVEEAKLRIPDIKCIQCGTIVNNA